MEGRAGGLSQTCCSGGSVRSVCNQAETFGRLTKKECLNRHHLQLYGVGSLQCCRWRYKKRPQLIKSNESRCEDGELSVLKITKTKYDSA